MTYAALDNLEEIIPYRELVNLTNDKAPADTVNEAVSGSALAYADEVINAYLRNKYKLPLSYVPQIIVQAAADIAAYRLYSRRPQNLPEHIRDEYNNAIGILKNLQKEQMVLDLPAEHPEADVTKAAKMVLSNKTSSSRLFNDELWGSYR